MTQSRPRPLGFGGRIDAEGVRVEGAEVTGAATILNPGALRFIAGLERAFGRRREEALAARRERQARIDAGEALDFPAETAELRAAEWTVPAAPADLLDRRVEITGPPVRKMVIHALNSGAGVYMADFEDSHAPVWAATIQGQANLGDAVRGRIESADSQGRLLTLNDRTATLVVRPRGWHLVESRLQVDGRPVSASLFDFGLFLYHNARELLARRTGPYFYLPKLESRQEARLWNDVFVWAQKELGLKVGTIRATVLIETLPAAFEMEEILYELRTHASGLNCGRWDYIFSVIKTLAKRPGFVLPDRATLTMAAPFLRAYSRRLIRVCHRRGAHAMGGMAAQIPIKDDPVANEAALAKVREDKEREAGDGHDGTWVAHPGLVPVAREIFERRLGGAPHQLARAPEGPAETAEDLLRFPQGPVTAEGLDANLDIGLRYLSAWLSGNGCVPIRHLMEDAATAEISRAQVWQWVRRGARLSDGRPVTAALARERLAAHLERLLGEDAADPARARRAAELLQRLIEAEDFPPFLTSEAYPLLG